MSVLIVTPSKLHKHLRRSACNLGVLLACCAGAAQAMSLQQAYDAALKNDPAFRMNFFESEAGKEYRVLGRAALLPQLSASYSTGRNRADQTTVNGRTQIESHPKYTSRSGTVQLRQPLFSLDALARYKQGLAQSEEALAKYELGSDDVILRTVSAYSDALFAQDQLTLSVAQRDALLEHMKVNKWLFEKGEGTKTDMLEIQARLDLAEAHVLEAQDALTAAINALEGVVGMPVDRLDHLSQEFRVPALQPSSFEDWRSMAMENNPELKAARLAVEVQRQEVNKARAGHAPRLDFVASYSDADSESITTYTQSTVNRSIGIQLNIPLYSGGQVSSLTRQAVAVRERARAELDVRTSRVLVDLRKAHSLVISSVAKVEALDKAVESGKLLLKATEQSIKGGVRINLDLLNAQQQLETSQRDLAQARYGYLLGLIRLKAASGTLSGADVHDLARYFR